MRFGKRPLSETQRQLLKPESTLGPARQLLSRLKLELTLGPTLPMSGCSRWMEIMSHSSTELIPSEAEDEEMELVELPETTSGCAYHELSPAGPPSADRCSEATPRGPPSVDPEDEPENKRRRPRSCLKWLTSPVLRQSIALPADGNFEDYEGMIFPRSASVICPSLEMVAMAVFQTFQGASMSDVRQLTACSNAGLPRDQGAYRWQ